MVILTELKPKVITEPSSFARLRRADNEMKLPGSRASSYGNHVLRRAVTPDPTLSYRTVRGSGPQPGNPAGVADGPDPALNLRLVWFNRFNSTRGGAGIRRYRARFCSSRR